MGAVLGLTLGSGLLLVWLSLVSPAAAAERRSRLRETLDRAGLNSVSVRSVLLVSAVSALVVLFAVQLLSGTLPVSVAFSTMAAYLPFALVQGRARSRQRELAEVWPDAVDNLASAVRAGLSLAEAVSGLGERGPEQLREPFQVFAREYQASGRFEESLDRLKVRLADPVGDRVVEGLRIAREVGGGDLGRLLRNLSTHLRDDARTRSELEARQAWAVNGARLAVSAPWLVLLMMSFQREVISRYASPTGVLILVVGTGLCLVAYRLMLRIGRLPTERRVIA
jgi:tight adherence protein B